MEIYFFTVFLFVYAAYKHFSEKDSREELKKWRNKSFELDQKEKTLKFLESKMESQYQNKVSSIVSLYRTEYDNFKRDFIESMNNEKNKLNEERTKIEQLKEQNSEILERFQNSMLEGRKWLCDLVALQWANKDTRDQYLMIKSHVAPKSASEVKKLIKEEKRKLCAENLFLKSKIATYKEYFPFLDGMEDEILEESIDISTVDKNSQYDRTRDFLTKDEFQVLSATERNQLALDRYFDKASSKGIGMLYELFLGYHYEKQGYSVIYPGVTEGLNDRGRDLICIKPEETLIIQAKCWGKEKLVRENTVCQLFGTMSEYRKIHPLENVKGILYLQNKLSEVGKDFAFALGIEVQENYKLQKGSFPTIKCNISKDGEKIYHLPFDQQYRKTLIDKPGEFMAFTVKEAEDKGFRRAFRNTKVSRIRAFRQSSSKQHDQ